MTSSPGALFLAAAKDMLSCSPDATRGGNYLNQGSAIRCPAGDGQAGGPCHTSSAADRLPKTPLTEGLPQLPLSSVICQSRPNTKQWQSCPGPKPWELQPPLSTSFSDERLPRTVISSTGASEEKEVARRECCSYDCANHLRHGEPPPSATHQ